MNFQFFILFVSQWHSLLFRLFPVSVLTFCHFRMSAGSPLQDVRRCTPISTNSENLYFTKLKIKHNFMSVWLTGAEDLKPFGVNTWERRLQNLRTLGKETSLFCLLPSIFPPEMFMQLAGPDCTKQVVLFLDPLTSAVLKGDYFTASQTISYSISNNLTTNCLSCFSLLILEFAFLHNYSSCYYHILVLAKGIDRINNSESMPRKILLLLQVIQQCGKLKIICFP